MALAIALLGACASEPAVRRASKWSTNRQTKPKPTPVVDEYEDKELSPRSLAAAIQVIRRHVSVPVVVPSPLPVGYTLHKRHSVHLSRPEDEWNANLYLSVPDGGTMLIQWGGANFDGCGGDDATPVRIAGERGLIQMTRLGGTVSGQIVWPVKKGAIDGTYGIAGQFSRKDIIAMAESMAPPRVALSNQSLGC